MAFDNSYLGPAGIFSTGNSQSDWMQIEAEQFDDQNPCGYPYYVEDPYDDEVQGYCLVCDKPERYCWCPEASQEELAPITYHSVIGTCLNPDWYMFNLSCPSTDLEMVKHTFEEIHNAECICGISGDTLIDVEERLDLI